MGIREMRYRADNFGRYAHNKAIAWHVFCDNTTRAHYYIVAYADLGQNGGGCPDTAKIAYSHLSK